MATTTSTSLMTTMTRGVTSDDSIDLFCDEVLPDGSEDEGEYRPTTPTYSPNRSNDDDNDKNGSDSDSDDNINVIIDKNVLSSSSSRRQKRDSNCEKYQYKLFALNSEVDRLVDQCIKLDPSAKYVFTFIPDRQQYLFINTKTPISDILSEWIWGKNLEYEQPDARLIEKFNSSVIPYRQMKSQSSLLNQQDEAYGIFSAKYIKTQHQNYQKLQRGSMQGDAQHYHHQQQHTNQYIYTNFALAIIRNGKLVDYAIHNKFSNINYLVDNYKPKKIFYNSFPNSSLDVFLRYEYNPFFATMSNKLQCINICQDQRFNPLVLCPMYEQYCVLCRNLRDVYGFLSYPTNIDNDTETSCKPNLEQRLTTTITPLSKRLGAFKKPIKRLAHSTNKQPVFVKRKFLNLKKKRIV